MTMKRCPSCKRETGHRRAVGLLTIVGLVATAGLWLFALPFYPLRCQICGHSAGRPQWQLHPAYAWVMLILGALVMLQGCGYSYTPGRLYQPDPAKHPEAFAYFEKERQAGTAGGSFAWAQEERDLQAQQEAQAFLGAVIGAATGRPPWTHTVSSWSHTSTIGGTKYRTKSKTTYNPWTGRYKTKIKTRSRKCSRPGRC